MAEFIAGTGLLRNQSPLQGSASCGSTDLLSGLLLANPIKQALSGTSLCLFLLQPNSPGCPQGLAPKAKLHGWKVLNTGLSPEPSNSVVSWFPTSAVGRRAKGQGTERVKVFSPHTLVFIRLMRECLPIITGSHLCPVTSAPLKPQLFRTLAPLGFEPSAGRLQHTAASHQLPA